MVHPDKKFGADRADRNCPEIIQETAGSMLWIFSAG